MQGHHHIQFLGCNGTGNGGAWDVHFGSLADIEAQHSDVRFTPGST
jgi:hypothetical protein